MKIIWARQKKMEKKPKGAEEVKGDPKTASSKGPAKPAIVLPG